MAATYPIALSVPGETVCQRTISAKNSRPSSALYPDVLVVVDMW